MTTTSPVIDPWKLRDQRRAVIDKYANPDNRERFNNCKYITLDLWSEHPTVDRLVTNLAFMMWGNDHA